MSIYSQERGQSSHEYIVMRDKGHMGRVTGQRSHEYIVRREVKGHMSI